MQGHEGQGAMTLKLYGATTSRAIRCMWMLEELGLEYEQIPTDHRAGEHHSPEYTALNPNQHVPTLVDGDLVLWESIAINLYLAERYDGGLWPHSVEGRGLAYQWSLWGVTEVEQLLATVARQRRLYPRDMRDPPQAAAAEAAAQKPLGILDVSLRDCAWLAEERFTVADLNLASIVSYALVARMDLSAFPDLERWLTACTGRPAHRKLDRMRGPYPYAYPSQPK